MRIGIDARIYKTGIGRYVTNLLSNLPNVIGDQDRVIVFLRKDGFDDYKVPNDNFEKVLADYPPYSFAEQVLFLPKLWRAHLDLVHFTNFNVPILWLGRYVLTIHDLIHMSHSTYGASTRNYLYYLVKKFVYMIAVRWVVWRAVHVLAPSEATKNDVVRLLNTRADKVVVTYEGAEDKFLADQRVSSKRDMPESDLGRLKYFGLEKPYLLYVATMYPHKNHVQLLKAFQLLITVMPELQLALVGKVDFFSRKIKAQVDELRLGRSVILPNFNYTDGYLPDDDLVILYRNAAGYVFPSLKEGFGIPILEAQAFGLPVACARISCLPEIGGDAVIYFDPNAVEDMKDKMVTLLNDQGLRQELIAKGYDNLKRFSWRDMTDKTYQVYQKTCQS